MHALALAAPANFPGAHEAQVEVPVAAANVPAVQATQRVDDAEPVAASWAPVGQLTQLPWLELA